MEKFWSFSNLKKCGEKLFWSVSMEKESNFPDVIF